MTSTAQSGTRDAGIGDGSETAPSVAPTSAITPAALDALDLSALLCSRVCHDLINPAGAIVNGLEVLADAQDEETKGFALDLIKKSAVRVSSRLQFCRIAFGASGSAGSQIDLGDAEKVARAALEDDKVQIAWNLPRLYVAKNRVKLLLNLLLVAGNAIPRGGAMTVDALGAGDEMGFRIDAKGTIVRMQQIVPGLIAGTSTDHAIDVHAIQPYYTGLLARACGLAVTVEASNEAVVLTALAPPPAAAADAT